MKRIFLALVLLFCGVGGALWFTQSYVNTWEPRLLSKLETRLGAALQARVHIDSLTVPFFHRIVLHGVSVWDIHEKPETLILQAPTISLTISLLDVPQAFFDRNPAKAIGLISLDTPTLSLSEEILSHRPSKHAALGPLFFTVTWKQGTLQWKDARAPHGAWTLYKSQGMFRTRGIKTDFHVRGALDPAESIQIHYSQLGHQWSADADVEEASLRGLVNLIPQLTHHPLPPFASNLRGAVSFRAKFRGRLSTFAKDERIYCPELTIKVQNNVLRLAGYVWPFGENPRVNLQGEGRQWDPAAFGVSDLLQGKANVALSLSGPLSNPDIRLSAQIPQGNVGGWPFQEATLQALRLHDHWEFRDTSLRMGKGRLSLSGSLSKDASDLQVTAQDVSLHQAENLPEFLKTLNGRLSLALSLRGPMENPRVTGQFSLGDVSWQGFTPETLNGNLDISPDEFKIDAASDDSRLQVQAEGTREDRQVKLERLDVTLRNGATLAAQGNWEGDEANFQVNGKNLSLDGQTLPETRATLHWTPRELTIPFFHAEPGMEGSGAYRFGSTPEREFQLTLNQTPAALFSTLFHKKHPFTGAVSGTLSYKQSKTLESHGNLTWEAAPTETGFLSHAALLFQMNDHSLEIHDLSATSSLGSHRLKGHVTPSGAAFGESLRTVEFQGEAAGETLTAHLDWQKDQLAWSSVRWGKSLSSQGLVLWNGEHPSLSGQIRADRLDLAAGQRWLWPKTLEPITGMLSGLCTLSGSSDEPLFKFSATTNDATWRSFRFTNRMEGAWSSSGLDPFTLEGRLATGGHLHFAGRVSAPDGLASGSLEITQAELGPLAESLALPQPVAGAASGTFTVNGPLTHLRFAGHVEGGPLRYGKTTANPLLLQKCVLNMALAPSKDKPDITRLTLSEAVARTAEEEIRLTRDSFIEFNRSGEAALRVGADIRNVHLGLLTLFGGMDLDGLWRIQPRGIAFHGQARTRSLFINDYQLEQGVIPMTYEDQVLTFGNPAGEKSLVTGKIDLGQSPQLKFTNFFIAGKNNKGLQISGDIGPSLWDFKMVGEGLDLGTLGGLAGFPYSLEGTAQAALRGTGSVIHPHVEGRTAFQNGKVLGLQFENGSAVFTYSGDQIVFTQLHLSDPDRYTLVGTGVVPLASKDEKVKRDQKIDFSVRLQDANLGLVKSFAPEIKEAKGDVQGLLQIKGNLSQPLLWGSLRVVNGEVTGSTHLRHLERFNLSADLKGDELTVRQFQGRSGKGEFHGGGRIWLSGFEPKVYDLHLEIPTAEGIEVQSPELAIPESPLAKRFHFLTTASKAYVKGSVTFRGPADAPAFTGEATLSNGHFTFPPSGKNPPPPALIAWIRRIIWDVTLHFTDGAWFENELVETELTGPLKLKGPSDQLQVEGAMEIPQGKISYLGIDFDVRHARFDMRSEKTDAGFINTPYVQGIAESHVQTVEPVTGQSMDDIITLRIDYAPVNEIKPRLVSSADPSLSQEKVLARVTQLEVEHLTPQERTYLYQQQMVRLIDTSLATPLARNILKRTGLVDELRVSRVINPAGATPPDIAAQTPGSRQAAIDLLANTKYTLAKNLSNRLSLGYGLRFEPITTTELQSKLDLRSDVELSYRWFSNVYLKGSFDLPSTTPGSVNENRVTVEPRWRFGWWGSTNKGKEKKKPAPDNP